MKSLRIDRHHREYNEVEFYCNGFLCKKWKFWRRNTNRREKKLMENVNALAHHSKIVDARKATVKCHAENGMPLAL